MSAPFGPSAHAELRQRARSSGILLCLVAVVAVPAWAGFDRLLEPAHAPLFLRVRLVCDIPMLAGLWLLWRHPLGRRQPELLTCLVLAIAQLEIAWMVPRATSSREFYLLGFSLAIYASGCLMAGRPRWTAGLVMTTFLAFAAAALTVPTPMPARDVLAAVFYLSTAAVIGLLAHVHRNRLAVREMTARSSLEREQQRTVELLGQLERLSLEDPLTGLANRRRWDTELTAACARAGSTGEPLAVVVVDLDRFKDINDRHGHGGGDEALRQVARVLQLEVRSTDLVARLGGDELALLLPGCDASAAARLAERLREHAARLHSAGATAFELTLSLGVAAAGRCCLSPQQLMQRADEQLYLAKVTRNAVSAAHTC